MQLSTLPGARYAYWCVLIGVFVTAFYTFRLVFMTFHGKERMDEHTREHLHESPWVVTLPLVLLAIPSVVIGWPVVGPVLFGDYFGNAVYVAPAHDVLARLGEHYHGPWAFVRHGLSAPILGWPRPASCWRGTSTSSSRSSPSGSATGRGGSTRCSVNKYYFDAFNEKVIAAGAARLARASGAWATWRSSTAPPSTARRAWSGWIANVARGIQTGYLYHYAFATIIGLSALLAWLLWRS